MQIKAFFALGALQLLGKLSLSQARSCGRALNRLADWFKSRNAKVTAANIALCFPEKSEEEQKRLIKESLVHTAMLILETPVVWDRSQGWARERIVKTHNAELLEQALATNKGVLVLAPHLGNWELLGGQLSQYSQPMCMYQPPKQLFLDRFIYEKRQAQNLILAPTNPRGVGQCLKHLKQGGLVAILPDQCPKTGGRFAPFFGTQAYTMTLVHGLIKRTGCTVVSGFAKRVTGGFDMHFLPPHEDIYADDTAVSTAGLNKSVEACVMMCPEQYQWEYKRFAMPAGMERNEHYRF